jgi:hypothetical protein
LDDFDQQISKKKKQKTEHNTTITNDHPNTNNTNKPDEHDKSTTKTPKKAKKQKDTDKNKTPKKSSNPKEPQTKPKQISSTNPAKISSLPTTPVKHASKLQTISTPSTPISNGSSSAVVGLEKFKNKSKILDSTLRKVRLSNTETESSTPKKAKAKKLKHKQKKPAKSPKKKLKRSESETYNDIIKIYTKSKTSKFITPICEEDLSLSDERQIIDVKPELLQLTDEEHKLFESFITRELDPNGGAWIIYADQNELESRLKLPHRTKAELMNLFAIYFLACCYSETKLELKNKLEKANSQEDSEANETSSLKENDLTSTPATLINGCDQAANYAIGIVRNSASNFPELLDYFADNYPQMIVKSSLLMNNKEINTLRISEYRKMVNSTYLNGTFRYGPLLQTSLVGVRNEEIGDYFPDFIENILEANPFLRHVMPWGDFSVNENMNPMNSDDGPILWARPGEQMIPTSNLKDQQMLSSNSNNLNSSNSNDRRKKKSLDILRLGAYFGRATGPREVLFEDRTRPHSDNVGNGLETTAAVGVLKAVHGGAPRTSKLNRIVKDVVCFNAQDYDKVVELLKLDIYEPPVAQVSRKFILFFP